VAKGQPTFAPSAAIIVSISVSQVRVDVIAIVVRVFV
jgi:hypothetical protein